MNTFDYAAQLFECNSGKFTGKDIKNIIFQGINCRPDLLKRQMTDKQIIAAYQLLLHRDPESEQTIQSQRQAKLFDRIRDICLSEEFQAKHGLIFDCLSLLPDIFPFITVFTPPYILHSRDGVTFSLQMSKGYFVLQASLFYSNEQVSQIILTIYNENRDILYSGDLNGDQKTQFYTANFSLHESGTYTFTIKSINHENNILCRVVNIGMLSAFPEKSVNIHNIYKNLNIIKNIREYDYLNIEFITFGCTNTCNASCEHCPKNKNYHPNYNNGIMSLEFFEEIIEQVSLHLSSMKSIAFGMFNEALNDPYLLQRIILIREKLPNCNIHINTNAALFDYNKHNKILQNISSMNIQVSGFSKDEYEKIMRLPHASTYRKVEEIIKYAPYTQIAVPISTTNIESFKQISRYFLKKGANVVVPLALSNRCGELRNFEKLSVFTAPGICRSDICRFLNIDYDGSVVNCCQDFLHKEIFGNLHQESLKNILLSDKRKNFMEDLDNGLWGRHICRYCLFDDTKMLYDKLHYCDK